MKYLKNVSLILMGILTLKVLVSFAFDADIH